MNARLAHVQRSRRRSAGDERAIARSVLYASLFDYPLTLAQLRQTLIESAQTPTEILVTLRAQRSAAAAGRIPGRLFLSGRTCRAASTNGAGAKREAAHSSRAPALLTVIVRAALRPDGGAVRQRRAPEPRRLRRSRSLHRDPGPPRLERDRGGHHAGQAAAPAPDGLRQLRAGRHARWRSTQQDLFTASQIIHLKPLVGGEMYRQTGRGQSVRGATLSELSSGPRHRTPASRCARLPRPLSCDCEWLLAIPAACRRSVLPTSLSQRTCCAEAAWRSPDQVRLEADCLKLHTHSHRRSIMERFEEGARSWK